MSSNVVEVGRRNIAPQKLRTALSPPVADERYVISDRQFMDDVIQLRALRSYMIRQAKSTKAKVIELGDLNLLHFGEKGRPPTREDWSDIEKRSTELYEHLAESDRRRFLCSQIPETVVGTALALGLIAMASLVVAFWIQTTGSAYTLFGTLVCNLVWVAALGGIGSIAFIGMNALTVQEDATFDLTNRKLIGLRVVLGVVFGVVLTLPYGFGPFFNFVQDLMSNKTAEPASALAQKSILLLLPFVLGFSTTLVIMVLNRSIDAIQAFFGKSGTAEGTRAEGRARLGALVHGKGKNSQTVSRRRRR